MLLARLKPLSERKGHKVQVYMIAGARFYVDRGWYEVDDVLAEKLRDLHQDHYDPESPLLFDVCTPPEAERIEQAERAANITARATIQEPASLPLSYRKAMLPPNDLSTKDFESPAVDPDVGRRLSIGQVAPGGETAVSVPAPKVRGPKARQRQR